MAKRSKEDKSQPGVRGDVEKLRQLPADRDAEQAVLGSILLKPDVLDELITLLAPDDFFDEAHQKLYRHLVQMRDENRKIDLTLLINRLKAHNDYEVIGGAAYLGQILEAVPSAAHARYYAEIVREKATYRALIDVSTSILQRAYQESEEATQLVNHAEQQIFSLLDKRYTCDLHPIKDILHEAIDRMEARQKGERIQGGVETLFADLDALTGGLHAAELIVLAARPSMGKTALAMNIAENVAVRLGEPVLFVSLEMSAVELADRLLCSAARVNSHRLRTGTLSHEDHKRLIQKASELSTAPLYVDDSPSRTVSEIAAAARRVRRLHQGRLGLVVVDYLQLIEPDNPRDSRQEQVARIARRLKTMARELRVPVLCLAQLNRQAEDAKDHRPRLSHLRESGAIEQDADVVMFVHREEYYRHGEDRKEHAGEAELIVAKQRNGPVGEVPLVWLREYTRFVDRTPERYEQFDQFNAMAEEPF